MSVNPGFGGQSFIAAALHEDRAARAGCIDASGRDIRLEVDGGIKVDNIRAVGRRRRRHLRRRQRDLRPARLRGRSSTRCGRGSPDAPGCYTFADHVLPPPTSTDEVARPGSLALASLISDALLVCRPPQPLLAVPRTLPRIGPDRRHGDTVIRAPSKATAAACFQHPPEGHRSVITELEFKSLAAQGYNRIPLIAEAFADLETPLSLYLKLAQRAGRRQAQLPARIGRRRRALRPLLVHRPAGAHAAARSVRRRRTEVVTDGEVVETHEGNPLDFIAALPAALQGRAAPGPAALLRRPGRLLRLRRGALHRDEARADAAKPDDARPARHPAAAMRGAGRHRQPVGQALPDRLRRSGAARGVHARGKRATCASCARKLKYRVSAPAVERDAVARGRARIRQGRLPGGGRSAPRNYIAAGDMMQVQVGQRLRKRYTDSPLIAVPRAALAESRRRTCTSTTSATSRSSAPRPRSWCARSTRRKARR